jgi:hypothetical protein
VTNNGRSLAASAAGIIAVMAIAMAKLVPKSFLQSGSISGPIPVVGAIFPTKLLSRR